MKIRKSPPIELFFASKGLQIHYMGRTEGSPAWADSSGNDFYHRLYYLIDGEARVGWDRREMTLKPGHVYLFPAGRRYELHCDSRFDKIYFSFTLDLGPGLDPLQGMEPPRALTFAEAGFDGALLQSFFQPKWRDAFALNASLWRALSLWVRPGMLAAWLEKRRKADRYAPILAALQNEAPAKLSVAGLAKRLNRSASALSRSFKKDMGCPLKVFIERETLRQAKERLLFTSKRIREISTELGFEYESYFSRFFRKYTQMSPEQFRGRSGV
jgi:AraC-like DNA-binding protein